MSVAFKVNKFIGNRVRSVRAYIPADFIILASGGTAGNAITSSYMNSATHGDAGTWATYVNGSTSSLGHSVISASGFAFPDPVLVDGTVYQGTTNRSVQIGPRPDSGTNDDEIRLTFGTAFQSISIAVRAKFEGTGEGVPQNNDFVHLAGFFVMQAQWQSDDNAKIKILAHSTIDGGATSNSPAMIEINVGQEYDFFGFADQTNDLWRVAICDNGVLLGAIEAIRGPGDANIETLKLSSYDSSPTGSQVNYGWVIGDYTNKRFPFFDFTITTPNLDAEQTGADEVTVTRNNVEGCSYILQRNKNAAGWVTLDSDWDSTEYLDTDVVDTDVVEYRTVASFERVSSDSGLSDGVTLDDSLFPSTCDTPKEATPTQFGFISDYTVGGTVTYRAFRFTASSTGNRCKLSVKARRLGTPNVFIKAQVYTNVSDLPGSPIGTASDAIDSSTLSTSYSMVEWDGLVASLTNGVDYWGVLYVSSGTPDNSNLVQLETQNIGSQPNSPLAQSGDGSSWTADSIANLTQMVFQFYAEADSPVFLIDENFETSGTPAGWFRGGTTNFDYSPALAGSESMRMDSSSFDYGVTTITPSSEIWFKCLLKVEALPTAYSNILAVYNPDQSKPIFYITLVSDGTLITQDYDGTANATTTGALSVGSTYRLYGHYKAGTGANAVCECGFNTVDTRPTSGSNFATDNDGAVTDDAGVILLMVGGSAIFVIDNVQISTTAFD
jgi:hypothetical protein